MICGALVGASAVLAVAFVLLGLAAAFNLAAIALTDFSPREAAGEEGAGGPLAGSPDAAAPGTPAKRWALPGVVLLCLVMFVYVGFEKWLRLFPQRLHHRRSGRLHGLPGPVHVLAGHGALPGCSVAWSATTRGRSWSPRPAR